MPFHLFVALGFTSLVGQVLLMRELIVVFYGNELSLGIMLGSWLFWVGIGSMVGAVVVPRVTLLNRPFSLAMLHVALGTACLGSFMGVRAIPQLLGRHSMGEIVGYGPIVFSSFLVLAPLCLLLGFLFDLFCHTWSTKHEATVSIASVYLYEAIGAALGGAAFAGVFVRALAPSEIAYMLLILNLAAAASVLAAKGFFRPASLIAPVLTIVVAVAVFFGGAERLREVSLGWLWGGLRVTHSEDSIYGNIAFVEEGEQKSLYENGLLMFSHPDRFSAEEAVHFALVEHTMPKRVLLIGGGVSGSLGEVLKHPVEHVEYVELDPLVIDMARRFFPREITDSLEDPRVQIHLVDGRLHIKHGKGIYDVIIVNLPDPYTALINRFYTLEFFRECKKRLAADGILSFRVSSAENYISAELQQFLGCLNKTLREVFPDVKVVPGETNIYLACMNAGILTLDSDLLITRLEERHVREKLLFMREYYLPFRLSEERIGRLVNALARAETRLNTDLIPVCYYYDAVLWSKQFKDFSGRLLSSFSHVRNYWLIAAVAGLFAIAILLQRFAPITWGHKSLLVAVATTGFAEITIEVVTLLGFQAMHGYVYFKVAIIVTAFMVGLAAGAAGIMRFIRQGGASRRAFLLVQACVCVYPLLLLGALVVFSRPDAGSRAALVLRAQLAFPLLAFFAGFVGGLQFPLANALWLAENPNVARSAGYTYGWDLLGSCLGALFTSALLVPVFGIPFACITASLLNMGSLLLLFMKPNA